MPVFDRLRRLDERHGPRRWRTVAAPPAPRRPPRNVLERLDDRFEHFIGGEVHQSWAATIIAVVIEIAIALAVGLPLGHPWVALAVFFGFLPVFVVFVPLRGRNRS